MQRIRPFVDAKNPGDINDAETKAFENRIRIEAEDLKLESFGVEVSQLIFFQYDRLLINIIRCSTLSVKFILPKRATF